MKSVREIMKDWYKTEMGKREMVCDDVVMSIITQALTQERERAEKLVKALEFYAGEKWSDIDVNIFDYFTCNHKGGQTFDTLKFFAIARQALKEWRNENE